MPRRKTALTAGLVFHVLNRGVRRMKLFERDGDYWAFLMTMASAQRRTRVQCFAYCLMPNHFHLVLRPEIDGHLSEFVGWMSMVHSRWWHRAHRTAGTGPVYQGRFKALPVCADGHFLRLCRYVERNPLRAGLVDRAEAWQWSSLAQRLGRRTPVLLTPWPVEMPGGWLDQVNADEIGQETDEVRAAVIRSRPFGPSHWQDRIAGELGLRSAMHPIGRPGIAKPGVVFSTP